MKRRICHALVLVLAFGSAANAGPLVQQKGRAQLQFPGGFTLTLSDVVRVDLIVDGGDDMIVAMPSDMAADAKWKLVERHGERKENTGANRVRWSVSCSFAPLEPGTKVAFVFPPIKIRDGSEEQSVTFAPVYFEVTTQIKAADVKHLRGSPDIEPLPPIEVKDDSKVWVVVAAAALLAVLALAFVAWRMARRLRPRSSSHVALRELDRLVAMKLPDRGRSERFVTLLTMLVRRYLDRQFGLHVRRQTTVEMVRAIDACSGISAEDKQMLTSFLQRGEAVMFAQGEMAGDECRAWAARIRDLIAKNSDKS